MTSHFIPRSLTKHLMGSTNSLKFISNGCMTFHIVYNENLKVLLFLTISELLNVQVISLLLLFSLRFQGKIMPMGLHLEFLKALVLILVPQQILNHDQKLLKLDLHILYLCNIKMLVAEHPKSFIMKVWKNHTVKKRKGLGSIPLEFLHWTMFLVWSLAL